METIEIKDRLDPQHEMRVYHSREQGTFVRLIDLVESLLSRYDNSGRIEVIAKIIATEGFIEAAGQLLDGHSDEEWSSWGNDVEGTKHVADSLRTALLPFADRAAVTLVEHLRQYCNDLKRLVEDRDEYIKELKAQWPPSFEKYQPKATRTYTTPELLPRRQIEKLIEHVRENGL